ncbi:MAG TPA: PA14 domain-containing protein [Bryobacteraceae bacterium]|nr:PA14 domain-containing protein [Bryobacteraceae bacterium]
MKRVRSLISICCLTAAVAVPAAGWVRKNPFGSTTPLPDSLRGAVCHIAQWWPVLPNFDRLHPVGFIYTYTLDVPTRDYEEGMPGVTDRVEWFAIDYQGDFWIAKPGKYRFNLISDDGSRLTIDGKVVIDNDGIHPTTAMGGSTELAAGSHHIRVGYFQGPGSELALVLEVAAPGEQLHLFDMRNFRPPLNAHSKAPSPDAEARPTLRRDETFRGSAALTAYEMTAFEAMKARPHAFEFRSTALRFPSGTDRSTYVLAFELPGMALAATPSGPGKHKVHAVLLALVKDAGGRVVEKASQDFRVEVTDTQLAALRAATLSYTHPITLADGHFTIETVALDREAGRASTGTLEIDNPERKGPALSSLVLAQRAEPANSAADTEDPDPLELEGQRVVPAIDASLPASVQPSVFFVAYPSRSNTAAPRVSVQFLVNGTVVASQSANVPPPDASGAAPMTIAAIAKPGSYLLKITLSQGDESTEQSIRYSIAAK